MLKLTSKQQEIVDFIDGPLLVTAGPGSGKTRVLTHRITNIINTRKGKVLALTFSNKAAEEISERIKSQSHMESYNRVQVGTIHSFCLDVVTNKGNQIGLPSGLSVIESTNDKLELLKKVYISLSGNLPEDNKLQNTLNNIQGYKQKFISPEMIKKNINNLDFINIYESYNNILLSNRVIDFDDILFYAYRILVERPKVADNYTRLYKYIMIDEAQDLNLTQYKIIKALARDFKNIMFVGDSAQSIYGFNGSDSKIMTQIFVQDYNPKKFSLFENFRSTSKIIEAANKIQPHSESRSVYPLEGELGISQFDDEKKEAVWIANKIESLLAVGSPWIEHEIDLKDIAIIGRNRYLFSKIEEVFRNRNIDYTFGAPSTNLECETMEMRIFEMGMRVLVNPFDDLHYGQVNSYLQRANDPNDLLDDLLNNSEINNNELNIRLIYSIIDAWNCLNNDKEEFIRALNIIENSVLEQELDENFKFLIQNDIELWRSRWYKYCQQSVRGERNLSYFRNQVSLGKMNTDKLSGVSLLTVHMSKGLEFEVVFIIGLTDGTFPDYRANTNAQIKEELNNMFVAITRAKRECFLTFPRQKMMPWGATKRQYPSEYLAIIESQN